MSDKREKEVQERQNIDPNQLEIPDELPILPLHGFVFFPGMGFPLQIKSSASKQLIDDILLKDRLLGMVSYKQTASQQEEAGPENLHSVGVVGYIHKLIKGEGGVYHILTSGFKKIKVKEYVQKSPYLRAKIEVLEMADKPDKEIKALDLNLRSEFKKLAVLTNLPPELSMTVDSLDNLYYVAYLITSQLGLSTDDEQAILEISRLKDLLRRVTTELTERLETAEMSQKIQKSAKEDIDKKQREFLLRQQLQAIRKELGEDSENLDLDELKERFKKAQLSEEAEKVAQKELDRLARISPSSPEYTVSRTYIEWLLELPWKKSTPDSLDIKKAKVDLDRDHYGLERIKKRILEFLAVRKLKQDMHGPILCFVGPPGTGKTSLGRSIARTMGRKFVRISLGGVRDEAEIRGHRRTYIGAMPGRIIQSLKKVGSNNPLFMLDEIDKVGSDYRGDPSSALLEVLDPEQNFSFSDHYLEINFDLSRVMFITTANTLDTVPSPLQDRMEVITLSSYTEDEKLHIAKNHLIERQLEAHALSSDDLTFSDNAIRTIIRSYTREAGVRNLERELGAVCRGVAADIVTGKTKKVKIKASNIERYLGTVRFFPESAAHSWGPGLATGLAWTPVGGVLLFIETAKMKGKGGLQMTGKLGDIMKESANAALTYIRANATALGVDENIFSQNDIHIHVPEGATPKDGPSAGVAMVVSLASLFTGRPVRKDVAMTGEITLRGDVLPVGGIKEKVLAASRSGIKEVILPALNQKDVYDIRQVVKRKLTFHYLKDIREALEIAMRKE